MGGSYLFLIFALVLIPQIKCQAKLHVEILYESLCPDSLNFVTQQLHPVFKEVSPYVQLKLTPFGKSASLNNGEQFVCQHGPQECKGNRIQSCVLQDLPNQNLQVEYINCFMTTFKKGHKQNESGQIVFTNSVKQPVHDDFQCSDAVGVDFNRMEQCYSSDLGKQLQLQAELSTSRIAPKFVPTILYNGVFNQQLQDASLVDFRRVVCTLISQAYPEACQSASVTRL